MDSLIRTGQHYLVKRRAAAVATCQVSPLAQIESLTLLLTLLNRTDWSRQKVPPVTVQCFFKALSIKSNRFGKHSIRCFRLKKCITVKLTLTDFFQPMATFRFTQGKLTHVLDMHMVRRSSGQRDFSCRFG